MVAFCRQMSGIILMNGNLRFRIEFFQLPDTATVVIMVMGQENMRKVQIFIVKGLDYRPGTAGIDDRGLISCFIDQQVGVVVV